MGSKKILLSLIAISLSICRLNAQSDINQAKAVYIYNFLSHIMWQENPDEEKIVIGIVGNSGVYNNLVSYTKNRKIGSKSIEILKINPGNDALKCHVVYISEYKDLAIVNQIVKDKSCLVIGDNDGMNEKGATISFVHDGYKLKYKLSEESAVAHKLVVSKALKVMSL